MNAKEYLLSHSLNEEFVKKLQWELQDDQIVIPIFDINGDFSYNKYRHFTGDAKFSADAGSHPQLYCAEQIKDKDEVVLCEGEPDCVRLWQEGIPAVTGTFGVATFTAKIAAPLQGKRVYITLDTDQAGKIAIDKYVTILTEVGATPFIVELPKEFKDVSEYFTAPHTKDDFTELKKQALTFQEWKKQNLPTEYKIEKGPELMERYVPDEEWLIDRVLPADGFTFIVGAEATGKSFYTLTIAESVATGKPWLGQFNVSKQTNILFIDKENSTRRRKARIAGLNIKKGLDKMSWLQFPEHFSLADPTKDNGISDFAKYLSDYVIQEDIGLIIIDSFADLMVGNENSSGDVQAFFDAIRILFPNKAILVLHHENKPSQGITRNSSQRVRGSTNITAQIVSGFRVFAIPKTTNEFVLEQFKAGDAEKLKPFKIELVSKPHPYKPDKTYVSEVKHNGEYYDQEGQAERAGELIEEYLTDNSVGSRQDIIDYCMSNAVSQRTCCSALTTMVNEDILEKIKDGHKVNYMLK